jgi:hypothetical protein
MAFMEAKAAADKKQCDDITTAIQVVEKILETPDNPFLTMRNQNEEEEASRLRKSLSAYIELRETVSACDVTIVAQQKEIVSLKRKNNVLAEKLARTSLPPPSAPKEANPESNKSSKEAKKFVVKSLLDVVIDTVMN